MGAAFTGGTEGGREMEAEQVADGVNRRSCSSAVSVTRSGGGPQSARGGDCGLYRGKAPRGSGSGSWTAANVQAAGQAVVRSTTVAATAASARAAATKQQWRGRGATAPRAVPGRCTPTGRGAPLGKPRGLRGSGRNPPQAAAEGGVFGRGESHHPGKAFPGGLSCMGGWAISPSEGAP